MNAKLKITGNILVSLSGLMLFGSAGAKLAHVPKVVSQMAAEVSHDGVP